MKLKHSVILVVTLMVAVTAWGQGLAELSEGQTLDLEAKTILKQAPDDEAKLTAIRALVATDEGQSNWLAEAEARVLTRLGREEEAVAAAKRITDLDLAAMTELWARFHSGNYGKAIEVGEPLLARPRAQLADLYRLRAADTVIGAMKFSLGDDAGTRSNRVRVVTRALTNLTHTTLFNLGYLETVPVPQLVTRLVNFVRREGVPDAEQAAMLRHLIRITPVTTNTVKTVGDWKGWLARQGIKDVVLNDLVEGTNTLELVEIYATHTRFNIPRPYANSVYGEAYRRSDLTLMQRYLEVFLE